MAETITKKDLQDLQRNILVGVEKKIDQSAKQVIGEFTEVIQDMMSIAAAKSDIADLEERTQDGFDKVAGEIKSVRNEMHSMGLDMATKQDLHKLGEKMDDLGTKFDVMKKVTVDDHEKRITRLEHQVLHA